MLSAEPQFKDTLVDEAGGFSLVGLEAELTVHGERESAESALIGSRLEGRVSAFLLVWAPGNIPCPSNRK